MSVLCNVSWTEVDRTVGVQQTNREKHSPVISTFRWWARRPHAVVGALLDAATTEFGEAGFLVADPFSGGGTVAFEAARRGLAVYAQDLYPWPTFALASVLQPVEIGEFTQVSRELLAKLDTHRLPYQRLQGSDAWETTHILRVRVISCPNCAWDVHLFPEPLISVASRSNHERDGFSVAPLVDARTAYPSRLTTSRAKVACVRHRPVKMPPYLRISSHGAQAARAMCPAP